MGSSHNGRRDSRREWAVTLRLHLAARSGARARRDAPHAALPDVLRRTADRRRRRNDSQSDERHARREQRPREDGLGGDGTIALRLRDDRQRPHVDLQLSREQLDREHSRRRARAGRNRGAARRHERALSMAYTVREASERILANIRPLGVEHVPLDDALGRVLAHDVFSPIEHPPWDNSSMDGYAVRAMDVERASDVAPVVLPVLETVRAGEQPSQPLAPGTAIRIMTGAPVPAGADSVIRVEDTDGGEARVV